MRALLPLAAWLALGLPSAAVLWRRGRPELAAAVVPVAGALAILLALLPVAWLGAELATWLALTPLASLGVAAALAAGVGGSGPGTPPAETGPAASAISVALLVGACTLPLGIGFELAGGWPGYAWDGLVIWLVRARVLAESGTFPGQLFAEPSLAQGHWDYPLLFPALLAWFARLGGLELRSLSAALGLFAAVFPLATAAGLARMLRLPLAAAVALAPFAVPDLTRFHFQAYADPLLVLLGVAGAAWTTAAALRWDRAGLAAGGLALAAAVATKNEGILWLLAGTTAALLLSSLHRLTPGQRASGVASVALPGVLLFGLWQLTCRLLDTPDALASQLRWDLVGRRFAPLLVAIFEHLLTPANAPLLLGSLLALALLVRGTPLERLRQAGLLLSASAVLLGGLFLVYLGTPHELRWHVLTSLHRTLYGVVPMLVVAAACATALPRPAQRSR